MLDKIIRCYYCLMSLECHHLKKGEYLCQNTNSLWHFKKVAAQFKDLPCSKEKRIIVVNLKFHFQMFSQSCMGNSSNSVKHECAFIDLISYVITGADFLLF